MLFFNSNCISKHKHTYCHIGLKFTPCLTVVMQTAVNTEYNRSRGTDYRIEYTFDIIMQRTSSQM